MKIILHFDLPIESEKMMVEWIEEIVGDKKVDNMSPLRYVKQMEVEK